MAKQNQLQEKLDIYVLTMPERTHLVRKLKNHLSTLNSNLDFHVVDAITPEHCSVDKSIDHIKNNRLKAIGHRQISKAEIACSLGHLKMIEHFLLSSSRRALFFEDDVVAKSNCFRKLAKIIPALPNNHTLFFGQSTLELFSIFKKIKIEENEEIEFITNFTENAHAYLLDKIAARNIVQYISKNLQNPFDVSLGRYWLTGSNVFLYNKRIFWQNKDLPSLLSRSKNGRRNPLTWSLFYRIAFLKQLPLGLSKLLKMLMKIYFSLIHLPFTLGAKIPPFLMITDKYSPQQNPQTQR